MESLTRSTPIAIRRHQCPQLLLPYYTYREHRPVRANGTNSDRLQCYLLYDFLWAVFLDDRKFWKAVVNAQRRFIAVSCLHYGSDCHCSDQYRSLPGMFVGTDATYGLNC